jgi:hypothetical protein
VTPVELLDWSETTSGWPRILSLARGRGAGASNLDVMGGLGIVEVGGG